MFAAANLQASALQCEKMKRLTFPTGEVTSAEYSSNQCRVEAKIWPALSQSKSSFITLHLWLPDKDHWNARFLGLGNGGYSPRIPLKAMQSASDDGFAVAATDTGHQTEDLSFAIEVPERIDYWGRTSVHELSRLGTLLTDAYYQRPPQHRYFEGCSTGGHQALAAAQFYPQDYDGIIAGAPGHNRVALNAAFLWLFQQTHDAKTNKPVFTADDLARLETFFLQQCDAADGETDDVLGQPQMCKPDLAELRCDSAGSDNCFSADQITRIENILDGPSDPQTGEKIYPGFPPGTENTGGFGWRAYWANPKKPDEPARADFWRYWALHDAQWQPWAFDWHNDIQLARQVLSTRIDATQTNLRPFFSRGGKLLMYHGMADPIVPYLDSLNYAKKVISESPGAALQLYLVPGMSHCAGGKAMTNVNARQPLIDWVESGKKPDHLPAKRIVDGDVVDQSALSPVRLTRD